MILELEILRALILGIIFIYFLWMGKRNHSLRQKGWNLLLSGFLLLFLGGVLDIADEFDSLTVFWFIGNTPVLAILEIFVGFTFGAILLFVGFIIWLPAVIKSFKMEEMLKGNKKLPEEKVDTQASELEKSNDQQKENEEIFRTIFNKSALFSLALSRYGKIIEINPSAVILANDDKVNLIGKNFGDTSLCRDVTVFKREFTTALKKASKNECHQFESIIVDSVGTERVYEFTLSPVRDEEGETIMFIMTGFDITEKKHITDSLKNAKKASYESNRTKSEFIARVSHEVRTPMDEILSTVNLLKSTRDTEKRNEYIDQINTSTKLILNLVNDTIEFTEIETGQSGLKESAFNLKVIADLMMSDYESAANEKKLYFKIFSLTQIPLKFIGAKDYLIRIFRIVLDNAFKYTSAGSITVELGGFDLTDEVFELHIDISDTGIGIEQNKVDSILNSFTHLEESSARTYDGSGLGLTICVKLISLLGGSIKVVSKKNKGSKFQIIIPLKVPDNVSERGSYLFENIKTGNLDHADEENKDTPNPQISDIQLEAQLSHLETALKNYNAESSSILKGLISVLGESANIKRLSSSIEKYDFEMARKILKEIRESLR